MELDELAHAAFMGANYHLEKIKKLINSPGMQTILDKNIDEPTKKKLQNDVYLFHWHLRAFFWEMVATFDTILHWVNQKYKLGLKEGEVKWVNIHNMVNKFNINQSEWKNKYTLLENAWNSEWYYEVRKYRNFAHRAFLFVQGEYFEEVNYDNSKFKQNTTWLLPVRKDQENCFDIIEQLSHYLEEMRQLGENIFRK